MTGIGIAFLPRMMRYSSLRLLLCLILAPIGCQIRESEFITEPAKRPFDWTAKMESLKSSYGAVFDWTPYVPATLIRYKKDKTSREWKEVDRLEVAEKTDDFKIWPNLEEGAEYRFAIEVKDPTIDLTSAPDFLYLKVPKDGSIPQEDHVITPAQLVDTGVAYLRRNQRDIEPIIFNGGTFALYTKYLSGGIGENTIQLTNVGAPKHDKFHFVIKAQAAFNPIKIEVGPFDPNGPAPLVDIQCLNSSPIFYPKGEAHPKQKVRLVYDEGITYLVGDQRIPLTHYQGIYRLKIASTNSLDTKFVMISTLGKIYHFGQYQDGKWIVTHDADFYPVDFSAPDYDKLDWTDASIPEGIRNVKEMVDAILLINRMSYRPLQFNLTASYENLPDRKMIEVVKEIKIREREFNIATRFANISEIYFHNMVTKAPDYAFMRQEVLHSMGVGLAGTPKEIVDQLFANFKAARRHIPER